MPAGQTVDFMNYLQVGQPLDRYIIEAVIGTGGMGTVYRVRHQALQSLFAIKVLDPRLAGDDWWTVAVVRTTPYLRVGNEAPSRRFKYTPPRSYTRRGCER